MTFHKNGYEIPGHADLAKLEYEHPNESWCLEQTVKRDPKTGEVVTRILPVRVLIKHLILLKSSQLCKRQQVMKPIFPIVLHKNKHSIWLFSYHI